MGSVPGLPAGAAEEITDVAQLKGAIDQAVENSPGVQLALEQIRSAQNLQGVTQGYTVSSVPYV